MLRLQNKSHAVMAQRHEPKNSFDDFPTPPWATRALMEYVLNVSDNHNLSCREPACGRGYISQVLNEYFEKVISSDVKDYGFGEKKDFLSSCYMEKTDWVITNPPFNIAENFILKALSLSKIGVAVLVRTSFLEGVGRYERLLKIIFHIYLLLPKRKF